MASFLNRVWFLTPTVGTGAVTPGAAVLGYRAPLAAGAVDQAQYPYTIIERNAWETGIGTWSTAGGGSLARSLLQSSTGALLNLAGAAMVAFEALAENMPITTETLVTDGATYASVSTDQKILTSGTTGGATSVTLADSRTYNQPVLVKALVPAGGASSNAITVAFSLGQTADNLSTVPITTIGGGYWFHPLKAGGWYLTAA